MNGAHEVQVEREANVFARMLLMPDFMVEQWCAEHPKFTVPQIAKAFGVGEALAVVRLHELQIDFDIAG